MPGRSRALQFEAHLQRPSLSGKRPEVPSSILQHQLRAASVAARLPVEFRFKDAMACTWTQKLHLMKPAVAEPAVALILESGAVVTTGLNFEHFLSAEQGPYFAVTMRACLWGKSSLEILQSVRQAGLCQSHQTRTPHGARQGKVTGRRKCTACPDL